jgi:hypothetical protein
MRLAFVAKYLSLLALPPILLACGSMVTFSSMETSLNAEVGKAAPDLTVGHTSWMYAYHDVDSETYELTSLRPHECNYALVVRKKDKTIIGWHYLRSPPPTGCKFQSVKQLM